MLLPLTALFIPSLNDYFSSTFIAMWYFSIIAFCLIFVALFLAAPYYRLKLMTVGDPEHFGVAHRRLFRPHLSSCRPRRLFRGGCWGLGGCVTQG